MNNAITCTETLANNNPDCLRNRRVRLDWYAARTLEKRSGVVTITGVRPAVLPYSGASCLRANGVCKGERFPCESYDGGATWHAVP